MLSVNQYTVVVVVSFNWYEVYQKVSKMNIEYLKFQNLILKLPMKMSTLLNNLYNKVMSYDV